MRRICWVVLLAAAPLLAGCGGEKDKGKHKDKDRPQKADKTSLLAPRDGTFGTCRFLHPRPNGKLETCRHLPKECECPC
jgi:hypothetical protein